MEEEYSILEKVSDTKSKYVPVSMKIYKISDSGYNKNSFPWHRLWIDRHVNKGQEVYIVSYIQHSGSDHDSKAFFKESDARKYIDALARAIIYQNKTESVEVHYDQGVEKLQDVLKMPMDTYINFRTPLEEYSITLAKTIY